MSLEMVWRVCAAQFWTGGGRSLRQAASGKCFLPNYPKRYDGPHLGRLNTAEEHSDTAVCRVAPDTESRSSPSQPMLFLVWCGITQ
jgi:hypothetical protein